MGVLPYISFEQGGGLIIRQGLVMQITTSYTYTRTLSRRGGWAYNTSWAYNTYFTVHTHARVGVSDFIAVTAIQYRAKANNTMCTRLQSFTK